MPLTSRPSPPAVVCSTASTPLLALLYPAALAPPHRSHSPAQRRAFHQYNRSAGSRPANPPTPQRVDTFFINALVQAGSCQKHRVWQQTPANAAPLHSCCRSRRKRTDGSDSAAAVVGKHGSAARRHFSHTAKPRNEEKQDSQDHSEGDRQTEPQPEPQQPDTEDIRHFELHELRRLVDFYAPVGHLETWKEQEEREAREAEEAEAGGPALGDTGDGSGSKAHIPFHFKHRPWPNKNEMENEAIGELEELLELKQLTPEMAFEIYSSLSWPRAAYLSYTTIRNLLHCLGVIQHLRETAMMRYLSVIDDMKAAEVPIALADWNMAINFAGKCFRKVADAEVESALWMWRDMENQAGTKGNHVTFNILFDIAVKAGKFKLAEMVRNEMKVRGLKQDRFFLVSNIMWRGLARDGEGVRKAYRSLVEAGEIIDSAVMNCVITALFRANEPTAAEQVFERMKRLQGTFETTKQAPRDWRQRRELGYLLNKAGERTRGDSDAQRKIQEQTPVGPDHGTFKILIKYHINGSGNIERITELLDEMDRIYNIPLSGDIFYQLFWGFQMRGNKRYSGWTRDKLEGTFRAFLMSVDNERVDVSFGRSVVKAILLAFAKCTSEEKTLQVWEEIKQKWQPSKADEDFAKVLLSNMSYAQPYTQPA